MKIILSEIYEFIPEWNDNKALPAQEQIIVYCKQPNLNEYHELSAFGGNNLLKLQEKIIKLLIDKIVNLEIEDPITKIAKKIVNGKQLLETRGLTNLVMEISQKLIDNIGSDLKNFLPPAV